jgi:hypothetical protein
LAAAAALGFNQSLKRSRGSLNDRNADFLEQSTRPEVRSTKLGLREILALLRTMPPTTQSRNKGTYVFREFQIPSAETPQKLTNHEILHRHGNARAHLQRRASG